jgi:hypothetical protein
MYQLKPTKMTFREKMSCEAHCREPHKADIVYVIKQHVVDLKIIFGKNLWQTKVDIWFKYGSIRTKSAGHHKKYYQFQEKSSAIS